MNKKYNPTLLDAVVSGPGMKYPRKPSVLLGTVGEFAQGDLMDANAVLGAIDDAISGESGVSEKINKEIRDREAAIDELESSFTSTLQGYINSGSYNSNTKKIELKNGSNVIASIDADLFIKDGMVSDVTINNDNLVITFNTDSGKQPITIPLSQIFNPNTYYTKSEVDASLSQKVDTTVFDTAINKINERIKEYDGLVTSYIINQSGDVEHMLPEDMIEDHVASMLATEKMWINGGYNYIDVIARIRENSHLYIGKYDAENNVLEVKQVSDSDKTKYADGTDIVWTYTEIDPETLEEVTKYYDIDSFMRIPEFWWKCEELATDVYKISFSMSSEFVDNTWNHWEGNTFIGDKKGFIDTDGKLYSRKGVIPTVNESWTAFSNAATARSASENVPYRIVTYEAHQIMCLLGYGWLGSTDSQAIVGRGSSNYPKTTGLCDAKGMVDTVAGVDGGDISGESQNVSINFWGLENWWGDISEWVDNIHTANSTGLLNIYDYKKHTVVRTIQNGVVGANLITKLFLGSNGDVTPTATISNSNGNRAFADYGRVNGAAARVASRSSGAAGLSGGLARLYLYSAVGVADAGVGSRLLYKGNYTIVDNFSE